MQRSDKSYIDISSFTDVCSKKLFMETSYSKFEKMVQHFKVKNKRRDRKLANKLDAEQLKKHLNLRFTASKELPKMYHKVRNLIRTTIKHKDTTF